MIQYSTKTQFNIKSLSDTNRTREHAIKEKRESNFKIATIRNKRREETYVCEKEKEKESKWKRKEINAKMENLHACHMKWKKLNMSELPEPWKNLNIDCLQHASINIDSLRLHQIIK